MSKKISLFSLVLLIVAAIDSIRNLPATAIFGSSLIFFFLFSAVVFLFPISIIAAEFAARYPEEGGIFPWVKHAFGEKMAFLAVWLQWINTMVWYPTILSFIAGTAAYLFDPALAQNKIFLVSVILTVFWGLTLLNLFGVHVSAKINSFSASIGTLIPMAFLIVLGLIWLFQKHTAAISFDAKSLFPSLKSSENWVSLVAIMASFLGMELSGVHVNDIKDPGRNFPKALAISVLILMTTMLFGALSIAVVIPDTKIRLVDGIMQTFSLFFERFNLKPMIPLLALLIIIGSIGGMINWLLSPAKGLLQSARFGFLPKYFTRENRHGAAFRILLAQAILVSLFCLVFVVFPTINAFYWFLTALSTELYTVMYILFFLAALKLRRPKKGDIIYKIPKGLRTATCFLGLFGCFITIFVSFFPPNEISVGGLYYAFWIALGNLILLSPVPFFWLRQKKQKQ